MNLIWFMSFSGIEFIRLLYERFKFVINCRFFVYCNFFFFMIFTVFFLSGYGVVVGFWVGGEFKFIEGVEVGGYMFFGGILVVGVGMYSCSKGLKYCGMLFVKLFFVRFRIWRLVSEYSWRGIKLLSRFFRSFRIFRL